MTKSPRNPAEALRLGTYLSLYSFEKDCCAGTAAGTAAAATAATDATDVGVPGALFVPFVVPFVLRRCRVGVPNGVAGADALDVPVVSFSSSSSLSFRRRRLRGVLGGVVVIA